LDILHRIVLRIALVSLTLGTAAPAARGAEGGPPAPATPSSAWKLGPALADRVAASPGETVAAWVFFTDRAGAEHDRLAFEAARRSLSPRALERRMRRGAGEALFASDLPVHGPYVGALLARGARLRGVSRWLNAASVELPAGLASDLASLPFVARVELVPRGRRIEPVEPIDPVPATGATPAGAPTASARAAALAPGDTAYYGGSFRQLDMIQVPQLHGLGLSGAGVLVCMLDDGFHLGHAAFAGLGVVATRDFIHGDTNVDYDPAQDVPGQGDHGTMTLGCVAGSKPGTYSGGAPGVAVALAKTEDDASETPVEMDYWQFGAEWADSLGADVISSSLGYSEFDSPYPSYTYADMNGHTTVVTLAAAEAARRGITVVNAAGNEGALAWHYIIAPGDADTVITVGAVDSFNVVTSFSSRGPTADGRIKPDVTADGRRVLLVSPSNDSAYVRASGTSFATPLTAGVVALLLEAHPWWRPFEVREALRGTALNHASPDNDIGWGLVRGLDARAWIPSTAGVPGVPPATGGLALAVGPNPVRPGAGTTVRFAAPPGSRVRLEVLDLAGRRVARLFEGESAAARSLAWSGTGEGAAPLEPGVYFVRIGAEAVNRSGSASAAGTRPAERTVRVVVLR
jgi:subtilisin family serine protease